MNVVRESIFISAIRMFFNVLGGIFGMVVGMIVLGMSVTFLSKPAMIGEKSQVMISADAEGNRNLLSESTPAILRINIHGEIGTRDLNGKLIQSQLLDSREGLLKNGRVKAILLHINSPGGTTHDSNNIYMTLMAYKEKYQIPIYAYVDGLCASGAMYIACSADKIFSNVTGIIGSVGVLLGPNFNFSGLMEKYGIGQLTLTEGKDKDMLSPYRPWKDGEDESLQAILAYDYERFTDIVAKSRPKMDKNQLINVYGAQVFDPIKAEELGYIDQSNVRYESALTELVKAANIEGEYQVVEMKMPYRILSGLIDGNSPIFSGKIKHSIELISGMRTEWMNRPLYLYSPALTQ